MHDRLQLCSNAVAGLSLGEYTALVHARAISFEDALKVIYNFYRLYFILFYFVKNIL